MATEPINWIYNPSQYLGVDGLKKIGQYVHETFATKTELPNGVPSFTSSNNGQILSVVDGSLTWITPVTIYTGTSEPDNTTGQNGDLYLQT